MIPGEIITKNGTIILNEGKKTITVKVANTGDSAIQVGSHYHFYETNEFLSFERNKTIGFRLNIPSGSSVRFEPGQIRDVILVSYSGKKVVKGFNAKINDPHNPAFLLPISLDKLKIQRIVIIEKIWLESKLFS